MTVRACGGPGSHKRSFQRLQPIAKDAAPPPAGTHDRMPPTADAEQPKPPVAAPDDDPWARLFRRVTALDDVDEQPDDVVDAPYPDADAEDALPAVPHSPPRRGPAASTPVQQSKDIPHADAQRQRKQQRDVPDLRHKEAREDPASRIEANAVDYTVQADDGAIASERAQQLALLARLGMAARADGAEHVDAAPAQAARPVAHGFSSSSSSEDEADQPPPAASGKQRAKSPVTEVPKASAVCPEKRRKRAAAAASALRADDAAWERALRLAAGEDVGEREQMRTTAEAPARPPSPTFKDAQPRSKLRRGAPRQPPSNDPAPPEAPNPKAEARDARVRQALAATRLGEGRTGVYYADSAFDWRSLAVDAGQQTWSLLGGAPETEPLGQQTTTAPSAQLLPVMEKPAPLPGPAAMPAFKLVDLAALGSTFKREASTAADARAAWEAHRDVLWDDAKRKRRDVKRKLAGVK